MKIMNMLEDSKMRQMKLDDILPCPLCAQKSKLMPMPGAPWWRVRCGNYFCGCTTWAFQTKEQAIAVWNMRSYGTRN